nr:hypothetical protein [Tanacetum cinerariifolium]
MRQVVLDNVMNKRTREIMSTLMKAMASCDAIREREREKDKAYAELEIKCNDALQDLEWNPLILDMRAEIETLQGKVGRLLGEYSRLVLEEKKRVNYKQTLAILRSKFKAKFVPYVAMKLVCSDKMGFLVARLANEALFHGKCLALEKVAALKEPFELEKMPGYRPLSKKEFDQAGDNLATTSYPNQKLLLIHTPIWKRYFDLPGSYVPMGSSVACTRCLLPTKVLSNNPSPVTESCDPLRLSQKVSNEYLWEVNVNSDVFKYKMSRDVITVCSTMQIPLLYRGAYSQWHERFMNYLEEQTDGEAMTNSIQNGDEPLPTAEEKKTRKIDHLARSLLIQGLPNDIYSLIDSNKTAKDLRDALERKMRGSEYDEQDRKAAILYEYETFKATEGEQLLDTYLRYLQVINDLKKCRYMKDNCELTYKFLNHLQPEWKQYGTLMRQTKNLMDINIDALYNILKQNQGDVNDALGYKKKDVMDTSDPLALVAEKKKVTKYKEKVEVQSESEESDDEDISDLKKYYNVKANVKDYNYYKTKMLLAKKDSDEQVLLAEDQAWMESSSDSDQEINANMVFKAQIEKVLSYLEESSSSAEETISEEQNNEFNEQMKVLNENNADLLAQSKFLQDQLKVKHVVIDTHTECQAQYAELEEERYEYMIRYSALCDNDKQHRKKINEQEILFDKMSRQLVEMNNNVLRLQEKILEKETKISELEGCMSYKDVEIEKCLERLNECKNKLYKTGQTNQTIYMIMTSKNALYNGRKGIGFEIQVILKKQKI